jgi:hypothetical protein
MRSPLTTIQGSSEIMTRYKLTDEKAQSVKRNDQLGIKANGANDPNLFGY